MAWSTATELWKMLTFVLWGFLCALDELFCRGRRRYGWRRSLARHLARGAPELAGRWAVVTGGNSGIGWETARLLASAGVNVIVACRSEERGADAVRRLRAALRGARRAAGEVELHVVDVADLTSVARFCAAVRGRGVALLVCNAGAMATRWALTPQGYEQQFGTHVAGHALMVELLLPELRRCAPARVVFVSSRAGLGGRFLTEAFARPRDEPAGYDRYVRYGDVKATQLCYAMALGDELAADGAVAVHAVHPGCVQTGIVRPGAVPLAGLLSIGAKLTNFTAEEGASYVLRACVAPDAAPGAGAGRYYHCGFPSDPGDAARSAANRCAVRRLVADIVAGVEPRGAARAP